MSQPRESRSVRTALPSRPVASKPHNASDTHLQVTSKGPGERGLAQRPSHDFSVSPEPRDSIMSDVVSTSSKASSPDSVTELNAQIEKGDSPAPVPSGQICRYVHMRILSCEGNTHTHINLVIAVRHRLRCGEGLPKEPPYVTLAVYIRRLGMPSGPPLSRKRLVR
jgi:hypothetical protein